MNEIFIEWIFLLGLNMLVILGLFNAFKKGNFLYFLACIFEWPVYKCFDFFTKDEQELIVLEAELVLDLEKTGLGLVEDAQHQSVIKNKKHLIASLESVVKRGRIDKLAKGFNYVKKPLYGCSKCMASFWGVIFLGFCAPALGVNWGVLSIATLFYIPALSGVIILISKFLD